MCYHYNRSVIMLRTQIQLTEEQAKRIKAAAARRGVSMAELVRQAIDLFIRRSGEKSDDEMRDRAIAAAGSFHSRRRDVAQRHDEYLAEDYRK